jgi:hypothetical protein
LNRLNFPIPFLRQRLIETSYARFYQKDAQYSMSGNKYSAIGPKPQQGTSSGLPRALEGNKGPEFRSKLFGFLAASLPAAVYLIRLGPY